MWTNGDPCLFLTVSDFNNEWDHQKLELSAMEILVRDSVGAVGPIASSWVANQGHQVYAGATRGLLHWPAEWFHMGFSHPLNPQSLDKLGHCWVIGVVWSPPLISGAQYPEILRLGPCELAVSSSGEKHLWWLDSMKPLKVVPVSVALGAHLLFIQKLLYRTHQGVALN